MSFERPEKPVEEFDEDDWHGVRFRNVLRACMGIKEGMEPMRKEDFEILKAAAKPEPVGRRKKPRL